MSDKQLPQTDSIQELAHFWDSHDVTEFEDQMEEVTDPVFERQAVIPVQLDPGEAELVQRIAKAKGIRDWELIRSWVLEKIRD